MWRKFPNIVGSCGRLTPCPTNGQPSHWKVLSTNKCSLGCISSQRIVSFLHLSSIFDKTPIHIVALIPHLAAPNSQKISKIPTHTKNGLGIFIFIFQYIRKNILAPHLTKLAKQLHVFAKMLLLLQSDSRHCQYTGRTEWEFANSKSKSRY